ncbi:phage integrase family protein [Chitinophaga polysaccharea]|uniref:phage integrase family protein n=1 Tax=Chitinophaga polysaccharea TaxID=1293035 RepID=UPI001455C4BF|nr:phage integrase family protein [Chitinophaga polysaccharea]NLR61107.1 phage integrase family protein [Chitinophaga polysaccharea]
MELPNGCRATTFKVMPEDWDLPGAYLHVDWFIEYWFHDPLFEKSYPRGKRCCITKGFATAKTLTRRRALIKKALKDLEEKLLGGYNPITKQTIKPTQNYNERPVADQGQSFTNLPTDSNIIDLSPELIATANKIAIETEKIQNLAGDETEKSIIIHVLSPDLPFIDALWKAYRRVNGRKKHLTQVRGSIRAINKAAFLLNFHHLNISSITPQHILICFEIIKKTNPRFSDKTQNKLRAHLVSLFKALSLARAVSSNFIREIPVLSEDVPIRIILQNEEIDEIDAYLKSTDYYFWRFIWIFYSSGCHETEMRLITEKDVNLDKREFTTWNLKGRRARQVIKPIPIHVLHLWKEVISECTLISNNLPANNSDSQVYLFSKFVKPGLFPIRADQYGRRWKKYVKDQMGIDKDMYKLKHLYTDRISAVLSLKHARSQNSHEFDETTKIYAVNEEERRRDELKNITIPFAGLDKLTKSSLSTAPDNNTPLITRYSLSQLKESSINILFNIIGKIENSFEIIIPSPDQFYLSIKMISSNLSTLIGSGSIFRVSQGLENNHNNGNWISACEMDVFLMSAYGGANGIPGRKRKLSAIVCRLIHFPFKPQNALVFENGKIIQMNKGTSALITSFADSWIESLGQNFLQTKSLSSRRVS